MKNTKILKIFVALIIITQIFIINSYAVNNKVDTNKQTNIETNQSESEEKQELVKAKVIEIKNIYEIQEDKSKIQDVKLKIISGSRKEEKIDAVYILSNENNNKVTADNLNKGNTVYVKITEKNNEIIKAEVEDVSRNNYIILLIMLFLICLAIAEKKKSIKLIINIVFSVIWIYGIFMLNVYKGYNAVLFSLLTVIAILIVDVIVEGIGKRSISAAIGTFTGVIVAGIITMIFTKLAKVTGGEQGALILNYMNSNKNFNFRGLIFSGMIIAVLGAAINNSQKIKIGRASCRERV